MNLDADVCCCAAIAKRFKFMFITFSNCVGSWIDASLVQGFCVSGIVLDDGLMLQSLVQVFCVFRIVLDDGLMLHSLVQVFCVSGIVLDDGLMLH